MQEQKKQRLGRGLNALLGENAPTNSQAQQYTEQNIAQASVPLKPSKLRLSIIQPNRYQPREHFDQTQLHELAESIKIHGVLQPILVRRIVIEPETANSSNFLKPKTEAEYEIVAGERRWRAAQMAGFHEIPVMITEISNQQSLEIAILENAQREDLNPMEQAKGYQRLVLEFNYSHEQIAKKLGKSRAAVANSVRLLQLPKIIQGYVENNSLSAGHARALIGKDDAKELADIIIAQGLSVREAEQLVHEHQNKPEPSASKPSKSTKKQAQNPDLLALAQEMSAAWGTSISINERDSQSGQLVLDYNSLDHLDMMIEYLMRVEMKNQ